MALNSSREDMIYYRKQEVARLRLRGLSQRAILLELPKAWIINPDTGQPYALGTVNSDIRALEAEWKAQAMADTRTMRGMILAEGRAVRHHAWDKGDFAIVLRSLSQETALLGLQRPSMPEHDVHYEVRYVVEPPSEDVVRTLVSQFKDHATPEEQAILHDKFEDWQAYARLLRKRALEDPEPQADDNNQDQHNRQ